MAVKTTMGGVKNGMQTIPFGKLHVDTGTSDECVQICLICTKVYSNTFMHLQFVYRCMVNKWSLIFFFMKVTCHSKAR